MLTKYILQMPKYTYAGDNSLEKISEIITEYTRIAIFTDKGIASTGLLDLVLDEVKAAKKDYVVFQDLATEPSYLQVQANVDEFKASGADFIIAVGGGSVMDAAKLASILATDQYRVKDLLDDPKLAKKVIPSMMIPTTAGTGAEVTFNAIVAVPEKQVKIGIVNPEMVTDYIILDARMIKNLPRKIAAATGVDALCHAVECYTCKKANPFSDLFALEAADLIFNNIEKACDEPDAMAEKKAMQIAAFYAGEAIVCSGTTAVHGLSYPLGGKYHIAHGVSNAMLLVSVMKFNEPAIQDRLAAVYDRAVHTDKKCTTVEEKSNYMIQWMEEIVRHLDIPTSLKEFNVPREDLDWLVSAGMEQQRLLSNNVREVTPEAAREIYLSVMDY
jgi:alcohol dehydrogenase class IV